MIRTSCVLVGALGVLTAPISAQPSPVVHLKLITGTPITVRVVSEIYPFALTPEWGVTVREYAVDGHQPLPGFVVCLDGLDGVHVVRGPVVRVPGDKRDGMAALPTMPGMFACERNGVVSLIGAVGCPEGFTGRFMMLDRGDMVHLPDWSGVVRRPIARVPIAPDR